MRRSFLLVSVSDRLNELQRQRALIQEHLAWLDREIATEAGGTATAGTPAPQSAAAGTTPFPVPAPAATPRPSASPFASADRIMAQYRQEPDTLKSNTRKGCFLYFFAALAVVVLGAIALYFYSTRMH